jgi:hypothetical protein
MKAIAIVGVCLAHGAAAEPELALAEPSAPAPQVILEDAPSPVYYRLPDDVVQLLVRPSIGVDVRGHSAALALHQLAGVAIGFGRGAKAGMLVEAGYSYSRFHDHLLVLGAGPDLRRIGPAVVGDTGAAFFALVPHAVLGSIDGTFGYGIRTSAIASFAFYGLELAHQYVVVGDRHVQQIEVLFTMPMVIGGGE